MNKKILILILKRIYTSIIILYLLISFLFFIVHLAPGSSMYKFVSPDLSPGMIEILKHKFSLEGSLFNQYFNYIWNVLGGDFGISYQHRISVTSVISGYLVFSVIFAFISFILQLAFGSLLAIYSYKRKGKRIDKIISKLMIILYSTPGFVVSLFLIYFFVIILGAFPSSGIQSFNFESLSFLQQLGDRFSHFFLPVFSLTLYGIPIYYKYLRENLEPTDLSEFVLFLRSHGYTENQILYKHIFPNAARPLITFAGIGFGQLIGGALIIEVIFGLPGMGRLALEAILSRNFPLVIGCTFFAGLLFLFSNLLADIVKIIIDKRTSEEGLN